MQGVKNSKLLLKICVVILGHEQKQTDLGIQLMSNNGEETIEE